MTYTATQDPPKTLWLGEWKLRIYEVDITNYDDGASGNGESFTPSDAVMNRFVGDVPLKTEVVGAGSANNTFPGAKASYDPAQESIRLYVSGGTDGNDLSELAQNGNNGALVEVWCLGV
jgi:hypothetical protein